MLIVTDGRWRNGAGNLIRQIEQSGMVDDGELDLLAEAFLAAGDALFWEVPNEWFGDEMVIAVDEADQEFGEDRDDDDEQPTVARREVYPPRAVGPPAGWSAAGPSGGPQSSVGPVTWTLAPRPPPSPACSTPSPSWAPTPRSS